MTLSAKLQAAEAGGRDCCKALLSEGLDLCVRARKLDAVDRTGAQMDFSEAPKEWWDENLTRRADRHNAMFPDQQMDSRSGTVQLWVQDQYEKDLAGWERRTRHHLTQGCTAVLEAKEGGS